MMSRRVRLIIIIIIASLPGVALPGQTAGQGALQINHDVWTFKDGAPEAIFAQAQTADGFIWMATATGLYRFDGLRFERFRSPFGDRLLSANIYSVFAPPTGGLWIGYTFGDISFIQNGRVKSFSDFPTPTGSVQGFAQGKDGIVWAATGSGLWRFEGSRWERVAGEWNIAHAQNRVGFDREGILWTATESGPLVYLRPGSRTFHVALEKVDHSFAGFRRDADGYIITHSQSASKRAAGNSDPQLPGYPLIPENVEFFDRHKHLWAEVKEGHVTLLSNIVAADQPADTRTANESESFNISPYTTSPLVDREGNVWLSSTDGLHRFSYSPLVKQGPLADSNGYPIVAGDDGEVWIISGGNNFHVAHGKQTFRRLPRPVRAVAYRARDKAIWLGGFSGLWRLKDEELSPVEVPPEMKDQTDYLQAIAEDPAGGKWISFGRHGLFRLKDGVWAPYGGRTDLPKTGVIVEFSDRAGRVWFGFTHNQVAFLDGDTVKVLGPADGVRVGNVTAINGRGSAVWIGGEFGLQQYDQGKLHVIQAVNDDLLRGISGIIETSNGDLWLNDLAGIVHIRQAELLESLKDPAYRIKGQRFGRHDGLPGLAPQLRPLPSAVEGSDGRLWFQVTHGVVWLDPSQVEKQTPPPPVTIESVTGDDKSYDTTAHVQLDPHTSSVQIGYAAASMSDPQGIRFRYKLEGVDTDWHETDSASPVNYRNLPPGSYHFSVGASDTSGTWADALSGVDFTILPAFYQTLWFRTLCAVILVLSGILFYRLHLRRLRQQYNISLEARVSERTRIARDLHDTLLQSFQGVLLKFHALTYIIRDKPSEAQKTLETTIDQARQAIGEARDAVHGLRASAIVTNELTQALSALGDKLAAEPMDQNSADFRMMLEGTPRSLAAGVREEIYRIAAEALRNAFLHAHAGRIEAEVRFDEQQLQVRIRDNGRGIAPPVLAAGGREGHYGLAGMQERADLIGGRLAIWSEVDSGTEAELTVPASIAYATSLASRRPRLWRKGA